MSDASTEALKSISTLLQNDSTFFIPSYQRGYRWKNEQVTQLLDDIKEFADNLIDKKLEEKPDENYYCLQPLVVKKRENSDDGKGDWEVIDGQQRLTTIYLILHYLNNPNHKNKPPTEFQHLFNKFKIRYETRENQEHNSHIFLEKISHPENRRAKENTNVDFLFMSKAYEAIEFWCNGGTDKIDINIIFNKVKFIWHNIGDEDSRKVFARINTGKIKLSNAELIKALFLQRKNFDGHEETIRRKQLEIAMEWDKIEYTLQNDEFWYFLNKEKCQSPTRIEFIFDLIANKPKDSKDEDFSFRIFYSYFKDRNEEKPYAAITDQWKEVRKHYLTFLDWYNDIELYHYIGFLVTINENLLSINQENTKNKHSQSIIEDYQKKTKDEFKKSLVSKIKNAIKSNNIEQLNYNDNHDLIKKLLLMFNIQYAHLNNKDKTRFPFHSYNSHAWSLEHIHAQNSEILTTAEQWLEWFKDHRDILNTENNEHEGLSKNIDTMIIKIKGKFPDKKQRKENIDSNEMKGCLSLHGQLLSLLDSEGQAIESDSIENLSLLECNQNTSLSNSIFAVKRQKIVVIDQRKNSIFIPPCTRYVFMKYFTEHPSQFYFWSKQDADDYVSVIKKTLKDYLPEQATTKGQQ